MRCGWQQMRQTNTLSTQICGGSLAGFVNAAQNIKCTTDQDDRVKLVDKLVEDLLAYGRMHSWIAMKG